MPFELSPTTEKDLPAVVRTHHAAFKDLIPQMHHAEPSDASFDKLAQMRAVALAAPTTRMMKVVDTDSGTVVGCSSWRFYTSERTPEQLEADFVVPPGIPEENAEVRKLLEDNFRTSRRDIMGTRPYVLLGTLTTHPDYQRKGAGIMMLEWGLKEADRLGLPAYLEASPAGKPLYERYGFENVGEMTMDVRPWGGEVHVNWVRGEQDSFGVSQY